MLVLAAEQAGLSHTWWETPRRQVFSWRGSNVSKDLEETTNLGCVITRCQDLNLGAAVTSKVITPPQPPCLQTLAVGTEEKKFLGSGKCRDISIWQGSGSPSKVGVVPHPRLVVSFRHSVFSTTWSQHSTLENVSIFYEALCFLHCLKPQKTNIRPWRMCL